MLWSLGEYDFLGICDLPGDEAAAAYGLGMAASGAVSTQTMRALCYTSLPDIVKHLPG